MLYGVHGAACFLETECHVLLRLAMSCLVKSQHGRFSQGARRSPDDVMW